MSKPDSYSRNVFINCPFDDKYFELLNTLLFTIVYFGYNPRLALETSDSGESRLQKIVSLIRQSQFSVHDLSRLQARNINEFYRLNMPFELGIDYGLRTFDASYASKRSLILETNRYEYMKAISDINGFDIKSHDDNPQKLVECLRSWFSETVGLRNMNSSKKIYSDFIDFNKDIYVETMEKYLSNHNSTDAEKFADDEIKNLTKPEYIDKAREWTNR